jgi:hypothetical protein
MYFTTFELTLIGAILLVLLAIGVLITLGNERVRRATLQVRTVIREYALTDLAMKREQHRQARHYASKEGALAELRQILLDVTGRHYELTDLLAWQSMPVPAISTQSIGGEQLILTPAAEAYLESRRQAGRPLPKRQLTIIQVDALNSSEFVVAELEAIARHLAGSEGPASLPRTEHWDLILVAPSTFDLPNADSPRLWRALARLGLANGK